MKYLFEAKDIVKKMGKKDAQATVMLVLSPREVPFEFQEGVEYVEIKVDTVLFILDIDGIHPCIKDEEGVIFRVRWNGHGLSLSKFDEVGLIEGSLVTYNESHVAQIVGRIARSDQTYLSAIGSFKTF